MDLPTIINKAPARVCNALSGDEVVCGKADIEFLEHTDTIRVMRNRFEGLFYPETEEEGDLLKADILAQYSSGSPGYQLFFDHDDRSYVLTVKFEIGDIAFPFSGRSEPRPAR